MCVCVSVYAEEKTFVFCVLLKLKQVFKLKFKAVKLTLKKKTQKNKFT
jgi:hypothetical protein